ncbi:hypothetical protein [Carnobacterium maltaromaticum]|uniref:hypothetical protein n=2 Tax=Carnobacterium maltaromaticum TaxID=2751 RepID=UPI0012FB4127|nr:hypothetical protein [Carnobacterium maltaromaticum]
MKMHDYEVISYEINLKNEKIKLIAQLPGAKNQAYLKFDGVLAHYFENELSGSIILDVVEETLTNFLSYNKNLLDERKNQAWPMYYKEISQLEEKLKSENLKYYIIGSSYGLGGWVLAKKMIIED